MLSKIIKYDIKATARYFIPLYLVLGGITLINKLSLEILGSSNNSRFSQSIMITFMILYVMLLIGGIFLNYFILILYFFRNLTGDEGYLTFTLPVKTSTIINGKLITAFLWSFLSTLITGLSILILISGHGLLNLLFINMTDLIDKFYYYIPKGESTAFFALFIISFIIGFFKTVLMFYVSIALGHFFGKYKILGSVASYFGLYFIGQILSFAVTAASGLYRHLDFPGFKVINTSLFISLLLTIILSGVYYFLTIYIFDKKLNLE